MDGDNSRVSRRGRFGPDENASPRRAAGSMAFGWRRADPHCDGFGWHRCDTRTHELNGWPCGILFTGEQPSDHIEAGLRNATRRCARAAPSRRTALRRPRPRTAGRTVPTRSPRACRAAPPQAPDARAEQVQRARSGHASHSREEPTEHGVVLVVGNGHGVMIADEQRVEPGVRHGPSPFDQPFALRCAHPPMRTRC